jgi:hypothetical protein
MKKKEKTMKKNINKHLERGPTAPPSQPERILTLRFDVENGRAPVTVKAPLKELPNAIRNMLADRLHGIDVCQLWNSDTGTEKMLDEHRLPIRIKAPEPTLGSLLEAVRNDQLGAEERLQRHRGIALAASLSNRDVVAIIAEFNHARQASHTSSAQRLTQNQMKKHKNMDPKPGVRPKDKLAAVMVFRSEGSPLGLGGLWFTSQKAFATLLADGKWHRAVDLKHSVQYWIPPEYFARLKGKGLGKTSNTYRQREWWFYQTMADMDKFGYIRHTGSEQGRGAWFTSWVQITQHGQQSFLLPSEPLKPGPPPSSNKES